MIRAWLLLAWAAVLAAADPVAQSQALAGTEDTALTVVLSGSDADGDPLSYELTSLPVAGTLWDGAVAIGAMPHTLVDPGHALRYVPAADDNGPGRGSFAFRIHDGTTWSPPATVVIDLAAVDDPPTMAVAASWSVAEGDWLEFTITGIGPGGGPDEAGQGLDLQVTDLNERLWTTPIDLFLYHQPGATTATLRFRDELGGDQGNPTTRLLLSVIEDGGEAKVTSQVLTITVVPVNDPPYAFNKMVLPVAIGGTAMVTFAAIPIRDGDFSTQTLQETTLVVTLTTLPQAGVLELDGQAMGLGDSFTIWDVRLGRLRYRHTGAVEMMDVISYDFTDGITATPGSDTIIVLVGGIGPPFITAWGVSDPQWTEGGPACAFAAEAMITSLDLSGDFTGGHIRAAIVGGGGLEDILAIADGGPGYGQIGVSGSTVTYGGDPLGTFTGGRDGEPLQIELAASTVYVDVANLLLQALRFSVAGRDPGAAVRTIEVLVNDGTMDSPPHDFRVVVVPVDDPPTMSTTWIGLAAGTVREVVLAVADPDTAALAITVQAAPTLAVVTVVSAAAHRLRLAPLPGATGSDSFTVVVDDGVNPPVSTEVALTITGIGDARPLPAGEFPGEVVVDSTLSVDIPFDCRQIGDPASLDFALAGDPPAGLALAAVPGGAPTVRATWTVPAAEPVGHRSFQILAIDPVGHAVGVLPVLLPVRPRPQGGG